MFECPCCGFRESPCWRASPFVPYAMYCTLDELKVFEPKNFELLKDLIKGEFREIGSYSYWLRGRTPHLYRILTDLISYAKGNQTEKPKNKHQSGHGQLQLFCATKTS